ncbi:2212_t:CDS:2 [Ambispora leptoticha]|uniref:2212_t:CDS:1 n=1 Tax=Ambispora leptoticha TaxID=144679 RepID=A0A9N9FK38_9GLOM|nr:2212_t:CDS:2 [Ambispora leptoticha]
MSWSTFNGSGGTIEANRGRSSSTSGPSRGGGNIEAPVGLGGLFAAGVPKLKNRVPPTLPSARPSAAVRSTNTQPPALPGRNTKGTSHNNNSSSTPQIPQRPTPANPGRVVPPIPAQNGLNPPLPSRTRINNNSSPPPLPGRNNTQSSSPKGSPRQVLPTNTIDKHRPPAPVLPTNGTQNLRKTSGQQKNSQSVAFAPQEPPTTEGRWTFHPSSDFPAPRTFINSEKLYPSGASSGSSIPLDLSSLSIAANPQRAPPPPPPGVGRINGSKR